MKSWFTRAAQAGSHRKLVNPVLAGHSFFWLLFKQWQSKGVKNGLRFIVAALFMQGEHYAGTGDGPRHCPCCGWRGQHFLPYIDVGYLLMETVCSRCGSHQRHRGHRLFYETHFNQITGRLLYISPEKNIDFFRAMPGLEVRTSQYHPEAQADYHFDLQRINSPGSEWDYILCHHVIEHLADDRLGMRELLRILKPGGKLILSVPMNRMAGKTVEYGRPNRLFSDHYYHYGQDFVSRIPDGFKVEIYVFSEMFTREIFESQRLYEDYVFVCSKL